MIYIQSNKQRTLPHHFDCACALYGAKDTCQDYRLTTYEELISGKFDSLLKKNLFVGSVEFMAEVFRRIGKSPSLPRNSNRASEIITLKQALIINSKGIKIFIKPLQQKLFTGFLMEGFNYPCLNTLPIDTKVLCYDPLPHHIASEWRLYIENKKIVDSRHYSGDIFISPAYGYAVFEVSKNIDFPRTYVMDIGILSDGSNVVIEYNDMYAIGNYGVPNDIYLNMLKQRYFEIING